MKPFVLTLGAAALFAGAGMATSAQAYEWGDGSCVGYGCMRRADPDGYRIARHYNEIDAARPAIRVYERHRVIHRHIEDDWDDDD